MPNTRNVTNRSIGSSGLTDRVLEDLSEDGKRIVAAIRHEIEKIKQEFLHQINEKNLLNDSLKKEVTKLNDKVNKLEEKVDETEAYERRDSLIFSGDAIPPFTVGENCSAIVCGLLSAKLKLNIRQTDISMSHRIGKKNTNQREDKRNIIVKLCRRDIKSDILSTCRNEKPNMYVNKNLTPTRKTIMYVLRKAKKNVNSRVSGCYSAGGRVFAWIKPTGDAAEGRRVTRVPVNTHAALETLCCDVLREPLSNYLQAFSH